MPIRPLLGCPLTFVCRSLKLLARWTVFTVPLARVINLEEGRLSGCALCISEDGTIAVIAVDGFQLCVECGDPVIVLCVHETGLPASLFVIPASLAPLSRICLGEANLLLYYSDKRARLWDIKTREFWRSMGVEKADDLVKPGGWLQWYSF